MTAVVVALIALAAGGAVTLFIFAVEPPWRDEDELYPQAERTRLRWALEEFSVAILWYGAVGPVEAAAEALGMAVDGAAAWGRRRRWWY